MASVARSLFGLLTVAASAAMPLSAQSDPAKLCSLLPPKLGGVDACREAVNSDPGNVTNLANLATAYIAANEQEQAIETLRSLVTLRPDSGGARLELARAYDRKGDITKALGEYREFARIAPNEPSASYYIGMMLLELRRFDEALPELRRAAERDSLQGRYHHAVGVALNQLGRREEAWFAFERSTRLRPADAMMWSAAARMAHATGRTVEAVYAWDNVVYLMPGYFDSRRGERSQWERAVREVGERRIVFIKQPVPVAAPVAARRARDDGRAASFTGSGFWVSGEGHLLTNRHVVKGCREIRVRPDSGASQQAALVAQDGHDDLALLKTFSSYPSVAAFRDGQPLRRGEEVVAVGFPLNGLLADQVNVTVGTVSALAGIYNDSHVLQMTAPVQQGNSGGPLFDGSGNVIGVVVTKLNARAMAAEIGDFPQNVNFAIKSEVARRFLEANRVKYRTAQSNDQRSNPDIGDMGRVVTVLVECFQ